MACDMRARADRLQGGESCRLRRSTTLKETPEQEREVALVVGRAKAGDREAVRYLYIRYANNVYGYVRSIVRDDYEAEDITQHVFAKLITVVERYEPRAVPFSRWILRLAHNAAVDYLRANRPMLCDEVRAVDELTDEEAGDRLSSLHSALAELSEEQRNVVVLRHVVGLSPGEIAKRLGKTESSIHGLHFRARGLLRSHLEELGSAPTTLADAS